MQRPPHVVQSRFTRLAAHAVGRPFSLARLVTADVAAATTLFADRLQLQVQLSQIICRGARRR